MPGEPAQKVTQPEEANPTLDRAEMANVLFLDLVGYSRVLTDAQPALIDKLQWVVQKTREFARAQSMQELIALPTGDGMALVFLQDPVAPVRCALEIADALRSHPEIQLRMGVNTGPVYRRKDINGKENVSGAGIDYAQRAMDRGDAGHILLTKPTADFLSYLGSWAGDIHDIGEFEIKHGKKIQLYNLYRGDLGNPQPPRRPAGADTKKKSLRQWKTTRKAVFLALAAAILIGVVWGWPASTPAPLNAASTLLTDRPGQELFPSLSPDGMFLIYASKTEGKWRILRRRLAEGGFVLPAENLSANGAEDDTQPAFSPDGKSIAFRSERAGGGIFTMDLTGKSVRRLTDRGYNPAWSPDGKQVAFAREGISHRDDRTPYPSSLSTVNIETGEPNNLYAGDAVQPSWSPHGQRIAFWYTHNGGIRDVATISAQGGTPVQVTEDTAISWEPHQILHSLTDGARLSQDRYLNWNPAWSPDGNYLYFASNRGGSMGLWRVQIAESTGKVLSPPQLVIQPSEYQFNISMARDGKRFVFVQQAYSEDLHQVNFDPATEKVGESMAILEGQLATRPDVSPAGDEVIFNASEDKLFMFKAAKNEARLLLGDSHKDRGPRWSPDGKRIAFFSNRSKNWEIWTVGPDGQGLQQITDVHESSMIYPVWSPKGDQLAYTIQGKTTEEYKTGIIEVGNTPAQGSRHVLNGLKATDETFTAWSWSPDQNTLAGYGQRSDGRFTGIQILDIHTQEYKKLTDFGSDPVWLSDGQRLLFNRDGRIWLVDKDKPERAKEILSVAPDEVVRRGLGVSRNDRIIYFSREKIRSKIYSGVLP